MWDCAMIASSPAFVARVDLLQVPQPHQVILKYQTSVRSDGLLSLGLAARAEGLARLSQALSKLPYGKAQRSDELFQCCRCQA